MVRSPDRAGHGMTLVLPLVLAAAACTGMVGESASPGPGSVPGAPGARPDPSGAPLPGPGSHPLEPDRTSAACREVDPGPAPLRRLTRTEYDNTVRELLGEDRRLARDFPAEELQGSFDNNAELRSVSDLLGLRYVAAAEEIARTVVGKLAAVLPCDPVQQGEAVCLERFLEGFGARVWRRPLEAEERDDLKRVFASGRAATFAEGIDAVVQVMILSPQFTYRLERGVPVPGSRHARLAPFEMASRLSYLLWGSMPDAPLFEAARRNQLGTRDEVMAQAERMLDDPRAAATVVNFAGQWLQLRDLAEADKDTAVYPAWKDEHLELFRQETERFIELIWQGDGKLDTLLTAPFSVVNGELAALYGKKGVTGEGFARVELEPTQRAGVLTQASFLAAKAGPDQSSPIHRGVFVREQLLCQPLPPPPPEANAMPPQLDARQTTKERFAAHRADPACASCHGLIDGIGFGFESYDAMGAWRTSENGKPIDAGGELSGTDVDGPFTGAVELGRKLVSSKQVEACLVEQMFNFSFGREKTDADRCTVQTLEGAFARSGRDLRALLRQLVQTDAFFLQGSPVMKRPVTKRLSRRTFLRGAGGVGIALPFLDAMAPRAARAQEAAAPRRLFLMLNQNGVVPGTWFPTGGEKDFKLATAMAAFEPLREHLIILDGIRKMERGTQDGTAHKRGHNSAVTGWTSSSDNGAADGASIDQVVAGAIGGSSRVKSLMTGRVTNYHFLHDGPSQVHPVEPDPAQELRPAVHRLFPARPRVDRPTRAPPPTWPACAPARRASSTRPWSSTGRSPRAWGPATASAWRNTSLPSARSRWRSNNAAAAPSNATQGCTRPPEPVTSVDYQVIGKTALDLCALAFACDLTRVAGLQWISHGNVFDWLGVTEKHHPLAHQTGNAGADAQLTKIVAWHAEQAAAFLTRLKGVEEAGGTVLDHTLFLWTNEISVGSHKFDRGPFLLASGKFPLASGGTLQTGRYLKYNGTPHTSVLQSVALALGAPRMPVYPDWDKGPLPNLI